MTASTSSTRRMAAFLAAARARREQIAGADRERTSRFDAPASLHRVGSTQGVSPSQTLR
ncbi:hypothetical protein [Brachybacterium huguangmaarense]